IPDFERKAQAGVGSGLQQFQDIRLMRLVHDGYERDFRVLLLEFADESGKVSGNQAEVEGEGEGPSLGDKPEGVLEVEGGLHGQIVVQHYALDHFLNAVVRLQ